MQRLVRAVLVVAIVLVAPLSAAQTRGTPPPVTRGGGGVRGGVSVDLGDVIGAINQVERGCHRERRRIRVIPIMAVFGADDNGGRALATPITGPAAANGLRPWRPIAPYLRSARGDGDYIAEWVRRSNRVLANSGAPFRFSETDIAYDRVNDTGINTLGTAPYWDHAQEFFRAKVTGPAIDPRYEGRLILLFSWGPDPGPRTGGLSDIDSWFVMMPAALDGGTQFEGQAIPGWYMMIHEFGHYMGLGHTFSQPVRAIFETAAMGARNFHWSYSSDGGIGYAFDSGASSTQYARQAAAANLSADIQAIYSGAPWLHPDDDSGPRHRVTTLLGQPPADYTVQGVTDTPLDMGLGWAPVARNASPCSSQAAVLPGGPAYSNVVNRTNPMSYTLCDTSGLRFTADQVAVMEHSFTYPHRAYIGREETRSVQVCQPLRSQLAQR